MAIEQFSKSDKEWRRRAACPDSDAQEVARRDFVVDVSGLWLDSSDVSEFLAKPREVKEFETREEFEDFWKRCDEVAGPGREPDWEEHLKTINESRMRGLRDV